MQLYLLTFALTGLGIFLAGISLMRSAEELLAARRLESVIVSGPTIPSAARGAGARIDRALGQLAELLPTPRRQVARIERHLQMAGRHGAEELKRFLARRIGLAALLPFPALLLPLENPMFKAGIVVGAAVAGYILPGLLLRRRAMARRREIRAALPDFLDLLAMAVASGMSVPAAIGFLSTLLANDYRSLVEELKLIELQQSAGSRRQAALRAAAERLDLPEFKLVASLLVQAERMGAGIARPLEEQARRMRHERFNRLRKRVKRIDVKLSLLLVFFFLPVTLILYMAPGIIQIVRLLSR